jgi:hypothetical protein
MKKYKFYEPHITGGDATIEITDKQILEFMKDINPKITGEEVIKEFIENNWAMELKDENI